MHLVHPRLRRQQGTRQRGREPQLHHRPAHHVPGHAEQLPTSVVDQRHTVLPVQHQQPLAYRVQGGLVVVVHAAELGRVHAVGVAAQPGVDDVGADGAQGQRTGRHADQGRDLALHALADRLDPDAGADQADDPVAVLDRRDRADRRAERAGVGLGERLAAQGLLGVAPEGLADLVRVGVRPADAPRVHDRDEVDVGVPHHLHRVGLELGRGVRGADRLPHGRGVGDRPGHRPGLACGGLLGLAAVADVGEERISGHDDRYEHGLHGEELARQAAGTGDGEAHDVSLPRG